MDSYPTDGAGGLFALLAIDPDVPSRNNSVYSEFLHWLVVNIPDEDIERGTVQICSQSALGTSFNNLSSLRLLHNTLSGFKLKIVFTIKMSSFLFHLTGDVLADYLGPLPSKTGGLHRFIYLVYRQPERIEPGTLPRAGPCDWASRARFNAKRFAQLHRLDRPRAINYFVTRFDSSVPSVIERCLAQRKTRPPQ